MVLSREFISFDLHFIEITLAGRWIEEGQGSLIMQQGDQWEVRGDAGIDLDEKSGDEEKWLGSEYILEGGANMNLK